MKLILRILISSNILILNKKNYYHNLIFYYVDLEVHWFYFAIPVVKLQ